MKLVIGIIIGLLLGCAVTAIAQDRTMEWVLNRVYNSGTQTINVRGV